ncbi:hypothetical protein D9619_011858 [Psilocybe cf. subviscida]|uniref:VHS domain-containing protein n=1 Tax=Psilocybe cf. subviscida TaxID=2480587 RepID=A0A8H5EW09_9AGAR|nr:hypothetical protein D9619_011858 [Psilocybe cf. subviscida]
MDLKAARHATWRGQQRIKAHASPPSSLLYYSLRMDAFIPDKLEDGEDVALRGGFYGRRVADEDTVELTTLIEHITQTVAEDWTLMLKVCDRASSSGSNAKEAIYALRRAFKYGEPPEQLSAARLMAIMLKNSSNTFISQSISRQFLDTLEDILRSSRTLPVVRERLLKVVAAAAYASNASKDPRRNKEGFKGLWRRVKPFDKPDEGVPFDKDDAMLNPPILGRLPGYEVPLVQNHGMFSAPYEVPMAPYLPYHPMLYPPASSHLSGYRVPQGPFQPYPTPLFRNRH